MTRAQRSNHSAEMDCGGASHEIAVERKLADQACANPGHIGSGVSPDPGHWGSGGADTGVPGTPDTGVPPNTTNNNTTEHTYVRFSADYACAPSSPTKAVGRLRPVMYVGGDGSWRGRQRQRHPIRGTQGQIATSFVGVALTTQSAMKEPNRPGYCSNSPIGAVDDRWAIISDIHQFLRTVDAHARAKRFRPPRRTTTRPTAGPAITRRRQYRTVALNLQG